jgi:tRNA threonylcarbamoyl adenosine modification protein (Sua5/YciO/YrdC/YwlC family)
VTQLLREIDDITLERLARCLQSGELVSFPTETVYGLGAHAGLAAAVGRIFEVKGRPAQDPLIVHCSSFEQTKRYISSDASVWQRLVHEALGRTFWPGPLTLILPCHQEKIVAAVTAGTGWVGLRCPNHAIALRFLEMCDCPVAAPSANLFGHVSPTTAQHVYDDFPLVDNLWIIDGGACGFGIESTVLRINEDNTLDILRRGGVGRDAIVKCLIDFQLVHNEIEAKERVRVVERYVSPKAQLTPMLSPGQLLVHYAPRLFTQMIEWSSDLEGVGDFSLVSSEQMRKTILIDFFGQFSVLSGLVGGYRDLSQSGSSEEAVHDLFSALRWAESQGLGDDLHWQIWIFNPKNIELMKSNEIFLAMSDRVYRASSGRSMALKFKPDFGQVFSSAR